MKKIYKDYLFTKYILVSEGKKPDRPFETLFSLANLFGIRIVKGADLADSTMIRFAAAQLGENVPAPFYKGFPESVRALTHEELLFDQMLHYFETYGLGDFSEPGHSVFEEEFQRTAFKEETEIREFEILTDEEADKRLATLIADLLAGSRPLSDKAYMLCRHYLQDHPVPERIGSKNTAIRLLIDLRDPGYAKFLMLSDVIKAVDELNYRIYGKNDIRKLNLKNKHRVFLTRVMDEVIASGRIDTETCYEKKAQWAGFLHHIHYRPKTEAGEVFVSAMRGRENRSAYSGFERRIADGDIRGAAQYLRDKKGSGAVLRNLNYLISRCKSDDDLRAVLEHIDSRNAVLLIQLLIQYETYRADAAPRSFAFTKHNKLKVYVENGRDCEKRRSLISGEQAQMLADLIRERLKETLSGRIRAVYIEPGMERYALPVQESTAQGGFGVLPRGSILPIGEAKILRAFTYWEKVDDIDLSVFGLDEQGHQKEFSWRTMADRQSGAITYSGDETSGFRGGSEYFDIDIAKFKEEYPRIRYLVFCDNVFSPLRFCDCFCRAGYMLRDKAGSGEIYEPKTVESAFRIDSDSRFSFLFGVDLERLDFIWLNMGRDSYDAVAGESRMDFVLDYFHVTDVINMRSFFEMAADEVVGTPEEADVIVTDKGGEYPAGAVVIREFDFERVLGVMERRSLTDKTEGD